MGGKALEPENGDGKGTPLFVYLESVGTDFAAGSATEHTYRPALKILLEALEQGITATNEPKRVECGAPDFVIARKKGRQVFTAGHLEAKDLNVALHQ